MSDLKSLYQEVILDHSKNPRNFGEISPCTHTGHGHNPLCGDTVTIFCNLDNNGTILEISFEGKGCAISMASASLLTDILKGKTVEQAKSLFSEFHQLVTSEQDNNDPSEEAERLQILAGVRQFPMRVKCATLPWHALMAALEGREPASTEFSS
ncbi:Fe-S cluster assembly sulfur transfer protein SufU [Sneathiella limimaris]|uniref:Fe-S cluster assembly sulfur transfer protein SufU n=1 Tax=Sneathiella limimaris TaxID=1964213 RepID=UPI00146DCB58|nr:SUF system NifU family Fe-S cluster assembly protein [Sneathiella limimaris]